MKKGTSVTTRTSNQKMPQSVKLAGGSRVRGKENVKNIQNSIAAANRKTADGSGVVVLKQSELDVLLGTIGKLMMESKSTNKPDAVEQKETVTEQRITNNKRVTINEEIHGQNHHDDERESVVQVTSRPTAPLSLVERKRLEWGQETGDAGRQWNMFGDSMTVHRDALNPDYNSYSARLPPAPQPARTQQQIPVPLTAAEKKRLKWEQEKAEMLELQGYSPWGRGGGGAPLKDNLGNLLTDYNTRKNMSSAAVLPHPEEHLGHGMLPFNPVDTPVHYQLPGQQTLYKSQSQPEQFSEHAVGSTLPPAAIRSSFAIGIPVPDEARYNLQKDLQKQQWLEELEKQRVEQNRRKQEEKRRWKEEPSESTSWADKTSVNPSTSHVIPSFPTKMDSFHSEQRSTREWSLSAGENRLNSAPVQYESARPFGEAQPNIPGTFLRGQNVPLDPETKQELASKRQKYLENQEYLRRQIEERERLKQEEKERRMREEMEQEQRLMQQPQNDLQQTSHNVVKMSSQTTMIAHTSQHAVQQKQHGAPSKQEIEKQRADQLYEALEAARLQAAKEKHDRLLQKLAKGNHDVSKLKARFDEKSSPTHAPSALPNIPQTSTSVKPAATIVSVEPTHVPGLDSFHLPPVTDAGGDDDYITNRVVTPTLYRQKYDDSSPRKEFGTQTDYRESPVEIEYHPPATKANNSSSRQVLNTTKQTSNQVPDGDMKRTQQQKLSQNQKLQWNYRNTQQRPPVRQSERDPTYEQRRQRRMQRQQKLLAQAMANESRIPHKFVSSNRSPSRMQDNKSNNVELQKPSGRIAEPGGPVQSQQQSRTSPHTSPHRTHRTDRETEHRDYSPLRNTDTSRADMSTDNKHYHHRSPPKPAVKHRLDTERLVDDNVKKASIGRSKYEGMECVPESGEFVPFMRTSEVLDPAHAQSPLPLSREPTVMVKARRAYQCELNPAKYGQTMDHRITGQNSLMTDHQATHQGRVLEHLSTLKKVLMDKQKEISNTSPLLRENTLSDRLVMSPLFDN